MTFRSQLPFSYCYNDGEDIYLKGKYKRSYWGFKMPGCYWLPGLKLLTIRIERSYITFVETINLGVLAFAWRKQEGFRLKGLRLYGKKVLD